MLQTEAGDLYLLAVTENAVLDSRELELTKHEFELLAVLAIRPRVPVSYTRIYEAVWGIDVPGDLIGDEDDELRRRSHQVRVLISAVRRKLGVVAPDTPLVVTYIGRHFPGPGALLQADFRPLEESAPLILPSEEPSLSLGGGGTTASLGPAEVEWRAQIGPLLTAEDLADWGGDGEGSVAVLVDLAVCLALPADGDHLYPAFQFDQAGRPHEVLKQILPLFTEARVDPYTVAAWFTSCQPGLDDSTPAEWLQQGQDDAQLVRTARLAIARLSR